MKKHCYGFIGLGLIGGSIAKALKKSNPDCVIYAYDLNKDALSRALSENIIDKALTQIDENCSDCAYIFLCAPVSVNDDNIKLVARYLDADAILTDVGSVKNEIHNLLNGSPLSKQFIGGHPMAGSEKIGFEHSNAQILENAYYILTPTDDVPDEKIQAFKELAVSMGTIPLILNPYKHDYITAGISHLPHIIAASLVNLVKDSDKDDGTMKMIAAGGFKDITRIASSSPAMWQQICLTNTDNIKKLLGSYIASLNTIYTQLEQKDEQALFHLFLSARDYRDSFIDISSGPIKKIHVLYLDIPDETGAIAHVADILSKHDISIKNIGIIHNREFEEGALRIEFYEESNMKQAVSLLKEKGITLYERK